MVCGTDGHRGAALCRDLGQVWSCSAQKLKHCRHLAAGYQQRSTLQTPRSVWASVFILLQHLHVMLLGCSCIGILNTPPAAPVPVRKGHLPPSPLSRTPWPWQPHYRWDSHPQAPSCFSECLPAPSRRAGSSPAPLLSAALLWVPAKAIGALHVSAAFHSSCRLSAGCRHPNNSPLPLRLPCLSQALQETKSLLCRRPPRSTATAPPAAPSPRPTAPICNSELLKRRSSIPQEPTQLSRSL